MASNSCSSSGFIPASEAVLHTKNRRIVWEEICHLQQTILVGLQTDDMCVFITSGSPMQLHTDAEKYYQAAIGELDQTTVYLHHLEAVRNYFHNLGYSIKLHGSDDSQIIAWKICWC